MSACQTITVSFCLFLVTANCEDGVLCGDTPVGFTEVVPIHNGSILDPLSEVRVSLLAFVAACAIIQVMKHCSARNFKPSSFARKDAKMGSPTSSSSSPERAVAPFAIARLQGNVVPDSAAVGFAARAVPRTAVKLRGRKTFTFETDGIAAAVRAGQARELPLLLDVARARAAASGAGDALADVAMEHLLFALRTCASHHCFQEALVAYDHGAAHIGVAFGSMWSLLLYSAVETRDFGRCEKFSTNLLASKMPSAKDFVNLVRYQVGRNDVAAFGEMLAALRKMGAHYNLVARNRALSVCTSNEALDLADLLAADDICKEGMDTVGFNTWMKGYASAGDTARCFELYTKMRETGLRQSKMTYFILLDACNATRDVAAARQVFDELRSSGLQMLVVHFNTFLKILVGNGELDEAGQLLDEMSRSPSTQPDLVTYSTLVKAHADQGRVMDAIRVIERMQKESIVADSILFNIVLTGCTVKPVAPEQVSHVLELLLNHGLQASTATLSIAIKAFAQSGSWESALDLLEAAPKRLRVIPEGRLYSQLAQACAREGAGAKCLAAYALMVRGACSSGKAVDAAMSSRLQRICASCPETSTAAGATQLQRCIALAGGRPALADIEAAMIVAA